MRPDPTGLRSLQEGEDTAGCTEEGHVRRRGEGAVCQAQREASGEASPVVIWILDWGPTPVV